MKKIAHQTETFTFIISKEMRRELSAIAFQIGNKGMASKVARNFMQDSIERYRAGLMPKQLSELAEIRENVILMESLGTVYKGKGKKKYGAQPPKFPTIEKKRMKI